MSDHRPQSAEPSSVSDLLTFFFLPHSMILIFVSMDSVLLFRAASRNLFWKLSVYLYIGVPQCIIVKGIPKLTYI